MYATIIKDISNANLSNIEEFNSFFSFWELSTAKNGEITGAQKTSKGKIQLHSSYNPSREAEAAFKNQTSKSQVIFLGFGLGYHVIQAAKLINNFDTGLYKKLILIENDPGYFFAAMCVLDWTEVFKVEQLVLAIGCPVDNLTQLIETTEHINLGNEGLSDSHIFTIPAFSAHNQPYFDDVIRLIERNKTKNQINKATYNKFAKLWTRNSNYNLKYIAEAGKVNQLKPENYSDDFLLVAAGPSLQNILPYIKQLKEKMIVVCVETALWALLKEGIQPDFIILTDPQYWAYRHIAGLSAPESILIAPLSVHPAVFRFKCKAKLLCTDMFEVSQFFEKRTAIFGDLGAGGSVASSALNLCIYLEAKNIYIAGLDLSYPEKQTHIKGSRAEQTFHGISNHITSSDKLSISSMFNANPEYGITYEGKQVLTDSRMKMFAWWFESRIAGLKNIKIKSLCKNSMKIPGVEYEDVAAVLSNINQKEKKCIFKLESDSQYDYRSLILEYKKNN